MMLLLAVSVGVGAQAQAWVAVPGQGGLLFLLLLVAALHGVWQMEVQVEAAQSVLLGDPFHACLLFQGAPSSFLSTLSSSVVLLLLLLLICWLRRYPREDTPAVLCFGIQNQPCAVPIHFLDCYGLSNLPIHGFLKVGEWLPCILSSEGVFMVVV